MGELVWEYEGNRRGPRGAKGDRGLPGLNGVENDEAFATYLRAMDSQTYGALAASVTQQILSPGSVQVAVDERIDLRAGAVTPEMFGATGDGVTDDTAAIQTCLDVADGRPVVFRGGRTYRVTDALRNNGGSIVANADGARFLIDHTGGFLNMVGELSDPILATNILAVKAVNAPTGEEHNSFDITLSVAPPHDWQIGDVIKIVSDDVIGGSLNEGTSSTTQNRAGTFLTLISVTGNVIRCGGTMDDPMTTNIKVGKMFPDQLLRWHGGKFDYTDDAFVGGGNVFTLAKLVGPVIEGIRVSRVKSAAVYLRDCVAWRIRRIDAAYGVNDTANNVFGYGVLAVGSSQGILEGSRFTALRCAYTDGGSFKAAGETGLDGYGRSADNLIVNCFAIDCTSSGFTTHTQSIRATFANCYAKNCRNAYSVRGRRHAVMGCIAVSCYVGFRAFSEGVGGESWGHTVDGLILDDCEAAVRFEINGRTENINYGQIDTRANRVTNVTARGLTGRYLNVSNAVVVADNWNVHAATVTAFGALLTNARAYIKDVMVRVNPASTQLGALVNFTTTGVSTAEIDGMRVVGIGSTSLTNVVAGGNSSQKLRMRGVALDASPSGPITAYSYASPGGTDLPAYN